MILKEINKQKELQGYSSKQLAEIIGTTESTMNRQINGSIKMSLDTALKLCSILNIEIELKNNVNEKELDKTLFV